MATVATAAPGTREAVHRLGSGSGAAASGSSGSGSAHRPNVGTASAATAAAAAGIVVPEGFLANSFFAEQPFFAANVPPLPEQEAANGATAATAADRDGQRPLTQLVRDLTRRDWLERMSEVDVYERDLHRLILNFFTVHGYEEAAEAFSKEAGMEPEMPVASIARRSHIREAVLRGRMEEAIRLINLIDPKILPSNPEIDFLLKQQQLLHLIEEGDTCAAIDFAQAQLAPCVKQHPDLLPKLEEAMALLAFNDLKCAEAQHLLGGMDQREQTARRIDEAILDFFNVEQESALETLTKNVIWTQKQIQKRHPGACPLISDVATGTMTAPMAAEKLSSSSSNHNSASGIATGTEQQQQQDASSSRAEGRVSRRSSSRRPPHVEEAEGESNGSDEEEGRAAAGVSSRSAGATGGVSATSAAGGGGGSGAGAAGTAGGSAAGGGTAAGGGGGATAGGGGRGGTGATAGMTATRSGSGAGGGGRSGNRPAARSGPQSLLSSRRTFHSEGRGRRDIDRRRREAS